MTSNSIRSIRCFLRSISATYRTTRMTACSPHTRLGISIHTPDTHCLDFYLQNTCKFAAKAGTALMKWILCGAAVMVLSQILVVSLRCCDALHSMLDTGVRWYVVGQGTLRAPDTRGTPPSSRHALSSPLPSLGSWVAIDAVSQLHGSAPALGIALARSGAVAPDDNTPRTTTIVSQTTSGPWRTRSYVVLTADSSDAGSGCLARQSWC